MTLTLPEDPDAGHWRDLLAQRLVDARLLAQYGDPVAARARAEELLDRRWDGSRVHRVLLDGAPAGHLWLRREDLVLDVVDLALDDPGLAPDLVAAVLDLARLEGAAQLVVGVVPASAAQEAFVGAGPFTPIATNLRLDLSGTPVSAPDGLHLDAMTDEEFDAFLAVLTASYAEDRRESGESPERATRVAAEQLGDLLPHGRESPDQHLFSARTAEGRVGHLWLDTSRPMAFVYDVEVAAGVRGRGHGGAIMTAGAHWVQERGSIALGLNVFAHNVAARRLYDRLGYAVTETHHRLVLTDA